MRPLPELRAVISSTAAVGSGVCRDSLHFFYPFVSLVPSGRGPTDPQGWGLREASPVNMAPSFRGGPWRSPSTLTPTGGERVIE